MIGTGAGSVPPVLEVCYLISSVLCLGDLHFTKQWVFNVVGVNEHGGL